MLLSAAAYRRATLLRSLARGKHHAALPFMFRALLDMCVGWHWS
jgi:hypothetical protein